METGLAQRTDEQLVVAARAALEHGDPGLARRCAAHLWSRLETRVRLRVARRVPRGDVDDVCSSVAEQFVRYVYLSSDVPSSLAAVVHVIADRRVADHTRSAQTAATPVPEVDLPGEHDAELDDVLEQAVADDLFSALDERSATIMRRSLDGESPETVARDLGITRSHLDVIAHRARKRLMSVLEEAR